jgi:hypothetical protein
VTTSQDRREFLRKAGLGAAVAGAWVAPQVLSTGTASAACSPITKLLQVSAPTCSAMTTTVDSDLPGCVPTSWATGQNDGHLHLRADVHGGTITITDGCTPGSGVVKRCAPRLRRRCVPRVTGSIAGNVVTFPTITGAELTQGCVYLEYRITVSCCL